MTAAQRQAGVDRRYRERGGLRLTMRISTAADARIDQLAVMYRCNRRDVVEGLLLGTLTLSVPTEVVQAMTLHGFSESEAREWVHA